MAEPWKHAALRIDDFNTHLRGLEYVAQADPRRYESDNLAAEYAQAQQALRLWLLSVRRAIDEQLALLPEPAPPEIVSSNQAPEKSAGFRYRPDGDSPA